MQQRKTKPVVAGWLLIILGAGIPIVSFVIPGMSPNENAALLTAVIIIAPFWVLPIIGGVRAKKRKGYNFVLLCSIIAVLYWIPLVFCIIKFYEFIGISMLLYLPVLIIAIPALILLLRSRKEFV